MGLATVCAFDQESVIPGWTWAQIRPLNEIWHSEESLIPKNY